MAYESRSDRREPEPWLQGVIFLGFFVYTWKGIGPHLLYHGFGVFTAYPVFSLEGSFLRTALSTPGGVLGGMAALLAQSYCSAWLGALAIVSVLGVLFLGIQRLLQSMQVQRFRDLTWVPLILALMIYNHYENPLPALLAIGLSIWTAIFFGSLSVRTLWKRTGLFLVFFVVLYYLVGASAFVFAAVACLTEAVLHRRVMGAILQAVLASGGAFVLGWLVFGLELEAIYGVGTPWDPTSGDRFSSLSNLLAFVLYAFVPGLIVGMFLGGVLMKIGAKTRLGRGSEDGKRIHERKRAGRWKTCDPRVWMALRLLMVSMTTVLCLVLSRTHIRDERALHYYAQRRDWDHVLALAQRMRGKHSFTRSGVFDINRALAHQGRLGSELCAYPQDGTKALFMSFEDMKGRLPHAKSLELYLDLGCLNAAEKNAYELLENEGPSPYVLEAIVRIHLAKGQHQAAQIVLEALKKYVGCREYVRKWQNIIADPAQVQGHALIQAWRRAGHIRDYAVMGISFEPMLKGLLRDSPDCRLAFEYLMAYYLLKHQRVQFVNYLPLLRTFRYQQLPRHYAEALLVHALETKTDVNAQGWTIEPDLQYQFREVMGIVKNARGDHQAAFDMLAPKYGDTYTFYSMFNVCGVK